MQTLMPQKTACAISLITLAVVLLGRSLVSATPITYVYSGSGTGQLGIARFRMLTANAVIVNWGESQIAHSLFCAERLFDGFKRYPRIAIELSAAQRVLPR
jgi:hypothetical protein